MANKFLSSSQDKTADLLLAIGAGFLINLILGAAIPEVGPFVAGVGAGGVMETGPFLGGGGGLLPGALWRVASIALLVLTNLIIFSHALVPEPFLPTFHASTPPPPCSCCLVLDSQPSNQNQS